MISMVQCMFGAYSFYSPNRCPHISKLLVAPVRLVIMEIVSIAHDIKDLVVHLMWTRPSRWLVWSGWWLGRHIAIWSYLFPYMYIIARPVNGCLQPHHHIRHYSEYPWQYMSYKLPIRWQHQAGHARWSHVTLMGVSQSGEPLTGVFCIVCVVTYMVTGTFLNIHGNTCLTSFQFGGNIRLVMLDEVMWLWWACPCQVSS